MLLPRPLASPLSFALASPKSPDGRSFLARRRTFSGLPQQWRRGLSCVDLLVLLALKQTCAAQRESATRIFELISEHYPSGAMAILEHTKPDGSYSLGPLPLRNGSKERRILTGAQGKTPKTLREQFKAMTPFAKKACLD